MWTTSVHSAYEMLVPKLSNSLIVKESSLHLHQVVICKSPSQYCWGQKWALRLLCFCIQPLWHPFNFIKLPNRKQKTHNYPHWNNCFKVFNPGLVLCIGRNKVWRQRMQKFSLTEWAHRYQVTSKMTWKHGNGKCTFACCFIWMAASFIFEIADIRGLADTPGALHRASCVCTPIASDYIDHMVNNWIQNNWVMFISIHMPLLLWTLGLQRTVGTKTQQVCVVSLPAGLLHMLHSLKAALHY